MFRGKENRLVPRLSTCREFSASWIWCRASDRLSGNYEVVNNLAQYYSTGNFRIGDKPGGKSARKHFIRPNGGKLAVSLSVL
jgi:hypothetical protein